MQPGWVRVYLEATDPPTNPQYGLAATCDTPSAINSITIAKSGASSLSFDIKVDPSWLADNGLPKPCRITQLNGQMHGTGAPLPVQVSANVNIAMDLPLALLTPDNTVVAPTGTSVSLKPTASYTAYPPLTILVETVDGHKSFVEVEELPERDNGGTVGLRGLATFFGQSAPGKSELVFELGGGGEIRDGWGLDVVAQGIWRAPQTPTEISNPGHDLFSYSGSVQPPILATPVPKVFPSTPLFTEADYQADVLDNKGVSRCLDSSGCMAMQYDRAHHILNAANGAKISLLTPSVVTLGTQTDTQSTLAVTEAVRARPKTAGSGGVIGVFDPAVADKLLTTAQALSADTGRDLDSLQSMPGALSSSQASTRSTASSRNRTLVPESPQELAITRNPGYQGGPIVTPITGLPAPKCVVNAATTGVTETPGKCSGLNSASFKCPTLADPIKVDQIGVANASIAALTRTIPPYYASRDNWMGTCASHAATDYVESLLDKYTDDSAVKRLVYVNGDAIVVPEPRVALTPEGGTAQFFDWDSTKSGQPTVGYPNNTPGFSALPNFPDAFWPAREPTWSLWQAGAQKTAGNASLCSGWWDSSYCMGQGRPGPGVYYSHSLQAQTLADDPLADPPWSLANHWFNYIQSSISLQDPDTAIQSVIAEIRGGLPVFLGFSSGPAKGNTPDGSGGVLSFISADGVTWYLPPELAGCTSQQLDGVLGRAGGHAVDIVGYWISGNPAKPDMVSSYFIIENNWGKNAGYKSFYFMNFAAFKYLANQLLTWRLDWTCWSAACARKPIVRTPFPPEMLVQLQYPPNPQASTAQNYRAAIDTAQAFLGGVRQ